MAQTPSCMSIKLLGAVLLSLLASFAAVNAADTQFQGTHAQSRQRQGQLDDLKAAPLQQGAAAAAAAAAGTPAESRPARLASNVSC